MATSPTLSSAQSVGGGGGNAGSGAGNTQDFGTGTTTSFSFVVGSQGGTGGNGGAVTVDTFAGNSIATHGSGAIGIVAQSIGGGGGSSQGGSLSVAQSFKPNDGSDDGSAEVLEAKKCAILFEEGRKVLAMGRV